MDRRAFLKGIAGLGGLALAAPWLEACSQATPTTPEPTASPAATATSWPTATTTPPIHPNPTATATQQATETGHACRI
ncbi:MAG: twin-arginine translocation signal domain-containing protein [Chloroflexi bacterium]|nr:MAG: twin-arginine translocation signal domain-containing protein [Chloroflexota bacterium]